MVKIEGLKKDYKDFSLDCSLHVPVGSITGLIGQNGAGKSTTFKECNRIDCNPVIFCDAVCHGGQIY